MSYDNHNEEPRRRPLRLSAILLIGSLTLFLRPSSGSETNSNPSDILVVANKSTKQWAVDEDEVKNVFLLRRERWRNGDNVVPINAPSESALRKEFVKRVLDMRLEEEKSYWHRYKIRHGSNPPPEFNNTLKAVFKLKKAVSYTFRRDYKEGVAKVLLVVPAQ